MTESSLSGEKVQITRIDPPQASIGTSARSQKSRASWACEECRRARAKCTGGERCQRCIGMEKECTYGDGKRELDKKLLATLKHENSELARSNQRFAEVLQRVASKMVLPQEERAAVQELITTPRPSWEMLTSLRGSKQTLEGPDLGFWTAHAPAATAAKEFASGTDTPLSRYLSELSPLRADDVPTGLPSSFQNSPSYGSDAPQSEGTQGQSLHEGPSVARPRVLDTSQKPESSLNQRERRMMRGLKPFSYSPGQPPSASRMLLMGGRFNHENAVSAVSWTEVTDDFDLVEHFLALYFCWEYPTFASLSREHFLPDFYGVIPRYCSQLLVNALLALGSRFSDKPEARKYPDDSDSVGEHFFDECKRLLGLEEVPSLPTIQALGLMSLRQASQGNDFSSFLYARMSMRMAIDLGLHLGQYAPDLREISLEQTELEVRTATFWGSFNLEQAWALCIGRMPQISRSEIRIGKPRIVTAIEDEDWVPYTDDGEPLQHEAKQRSQIRTVYQSFTELSEIIHDALVTLYAPRRRLKGEDVLCAYTRYLHWYDSLPEHLRLGINYTPTVLFTHMYYHFAIILLFRPFLRLQIVNSSLSPQKISAEAAESLVAISQTYHQLYTLRRTPSFVPYLALTSHISLLIASALRRDKNEMTSVGTEQFHWLTQLEELSVPHAFARRSTGILHNISEIWGIPMPDGFHRRRGSGRKSARGRKDSSPPDTFFKPKSDVMLPGCSAQAGRRKSLSLLTDVIFSLFPRQGLPVLGPSIGGRLPEGTMPREGLDADFNTDFEGAGFREI